MAKQYIDTTKRKITRKGSFFFQVTSWNISIQVIVGHTEKRTRQIIERRFGATNGWDGVPGVDQLDCPAGGVMQRGSCDVVLFLKHWPEKIYDYGVVVHEVFHIADGCLREKGITLSDDSDEAYAYLIESIFRDLMVRFVK